MKRTPAEQRKKDREYAAVRKARMIAAGTWEAEQEKLRRQGRECQARRKARMIAAGTWEADREAKRVRARDPKVVERQAHRRRERWAANPELKERAKELARESYLAVLAAETAEERERRLADKRAYRKEWVKTPGGQAHLEKHKKQVAARFAAMSPEERRAYNRHWNGKTKADPVRYAEWKKRLAEARARVEPDLRAARHAAGSSVCEQKKAKALAAEAAVLEEKVRMAGLLDEAKQHPGTHKNGQARQKATKRRKK